MIYVDARWCIKITARTEYIIISYYKIQLYFCILFFYRVIRTPHYKLYDGIYGLDSLLCW